MSKLKSVLVAYKDDPQNLLIETAWTYLQFALNEPDRFKLMFSSVLEKEKEYPDFVEISQKNFSQIVEIVEICQQAGVLKQGAPDLIALSLWGTVHGFTSLLLEGQISHTVLERTPLKEILIFLSCKDSIGLLFPNAVHDYLFTQPFHNLLIIPSTCLDGYTYAHGQPFRLGRTHHLLQP